MSFVAEERENVENSNNLNRKEEDKDINIRNDIKEEYTTKIDWETYVQKPKGNVKTYVKPLQVSQQQQSPAPKEVENANPVQPKTDPLKTIFSELRELRDKYYRLWDKIHQNKDSETAKPDNSLKDKISLFDNNNTNAVKDSDGSFMKLSKLRRQIEQLNNTLKTLKKNQKIDRHQLSSISPMLNQINQVIGSDKKTTIAKEVSKRTGKSDLADKQHGLTWRTEVENQILSEEEQKMSSDEVRNRLAKETQTVIDNIKNQLETLKKGTHNQKLLNRKTKSNQRNAVELPKPSVREKMKTYAETVVTENNKSMKKETFDASKHGWIPNGVQKTADNERYKTFNANVTDPSFHQHNS